MLSMNTFSDRFSIDATDLAGLGALRSLLAVEPASDHAAAPAGRCSALAFECERGVLLAWMPERLGESASGACDLRWSLLDDACGHARLRAWRERLQAWGGAPVLHRVPSPVQAGWHRARLLRCAPRAQRDRAVCHAVHTSVQAFSVQASADGTLEWAWGGAPMPEPAAQGPGWPVWLDPRTPVQVGSADGEFRSAVFDGWPLAWRRRFVHALGLAQGVAVNSLAGLPEAVREHPMLQEWTCRALALRLSAWPALRRRLPASPPTAGLPGIAPAVLRRWWPVWQGLHAAPPPAGAAV